MMTGAPPRFRDRQKADKSGHGARSGDGARLLEKRMENPHDRIGNTRRQRMPLPAALQEDLAAILADVLVAELREEDASQVQKATVESPGGTDRGTRNLAKDNGQGKA